MAFPQASAGTDTDFDTSVTSMPVTLAGVNFFDSFTGTSGTLLDAHTPNVGTSWTKLINVGTGDIGLSSNTADSNVAGYAADEGGLYTADATYASADYSVSVTVVFGDNGDDPNILACRIQDADNMYAVWFNNDESRLYKRVTGTWTQVGSSGAGVADTSVVRLSIIGTTLSFMDDGVTILSETVTDHSAAGKAGLGFGAVIVSTDDSSSMQLDNFTVTTADVGDLLLAFSSLRNAGTWTVPTDWTEFDAQAGGGTVGELSLFYKIVDGTELGQATWTASVGSTAAWITHLITDWHGTTPPESDTADGDATNADPPTLTPSWGSADTLWIAVASNSATTGGFTAAPTDYGDLHSNGASSGGSEASIATATRELAATSDDPGAFTPNSNRFWAAATVAIRPAGAAAGNLDTRNKRGSALGIDAPWLHIFPNPDGSIDQSDRQHSAYKYAAIAADAPSGAVVKDIISFGIIPFPRS